MTETPPVLYCANHPTIETTLRCNRCEKPICVKCAQLTPTGYRCRECVQGQQKIFETSLSTDYILAAIISGVLAFLGSLFIPLWFLLVIFVSPIAGTVIAEAVRLAVHRRRSRTLFLTVAIATAIGCLPMLGWQVIIAFFVLGSARLSGITSLFPLLLHGLYAIVVTTTAYYRLSGIQLRL